MPADVDELLSRLARGEAVADLARPEGLTEVLKRCAVVQTFDELTYDKVLAPGVPQHVAFQDLVTASEVERVPRQDGLYRLERSARATQWKAWWPSDATHTDPRVPADLREFIEGIVPIYRERGDPIDLLPLLAFTAPDEAIDLASALFRDADLRFDLPLFQDILDTLRDEERLASCDDRMITMWRDRAAYLRARSLWSSDYLRTGTFLEPKDARSVYTRLLGESGPRTLLLHGPGGRGKTMELRWLIARLLVPEQVPPVDPPWRGGRIPCTKHDFDVIDSINVTAYPWLILLDAATQLNQQLPRSPFTKFLNSYGWALPLLGKTGTSHDRAKAASSRLAAEPPGLGDGIRTWFVDVLVEAVGDRQMLMVFDTVEETHLRPKSDLENLLALLRELMNGCPALRIILSGRYDLREVLRAAINELPEAIDRVLLPFSDEQAERYLREHRGIDRLDLRAEIVAKVEGDPFKLALLADLVQQRPEIEPADLRAQDADLTYLIVRVMDRVDPPTRWLVRYGVVARRLSRGFVDAVLPKYLAAAIAGRKTYDQQVEGPVTSPTNGEELDIDRLWTQLLRYAGETSWVTLAPTDRDSVALHPRVLRAMRKLIADSSIHRKLHRDAAQYFDDLAAAEPGDADRWSLEALYHHFHLDWVKATRRWRRMLDEVGLGEPDRRETIASELLGPDYVDQNGDPREWHPGVPAVAPETVAEAWFERACALAQQARVDRVGADDQLWSGVERAYAEFLHRQGDVELIPRWRLGYLVAALAVRHGDLATGEREVLDALTQAKLSYDQVRLRVLLGDIQLARADNAAPATYRSALDAAIRLRADAWAPHLRLRVAAAYTQLDRLAEADRECAAATAHGHVLPVQSAELSALAARIALRSGRPNRATELTDRADPRLLAEPEQVHTLRLEAAQACYLDEVLAATAGAPVRARAPGGVVDDAARHESAGAAAGTLLHFGPAFDGLETARTLWAVAGDIDAVARCHTRAAMLHLREVGSLTLAEHHLDEADTLFLRPATEGWLRRETGRAELLHRQGLSPEAEARITETIGQLRQSGAPARLFVLAALAGLAVRAANNHCELVEQLDKHLRRVTPEPARVVLLKNLDRIDAVTRDAVERLAQLRTLLQLPSTVTKAEQAALQVTLAHLARLTGDADRAERDLVAARATLGSSGSRLFLRDWAHALDRLPGGDRISTADVAAFVNQFRHTSPTLTAAFLIERAEAVVDTDPQAADRFAEQAAPLLHVSPDQKTQWHARLQQINGRVADATAADSHLVLASSEFEALGDVSNARPPAVVRDFGRDKSVARLEAGRGWLRLELDKGGSLQVSASIPGIGHAERRDLERWARDIVGVTGLPKGKATFLKDASAWVARAAEVGSGGPLEMWPDLDFDLRLELWDRRLQAAPWEWALRVSRSIHPYRVTSADAAHRDEIRYVQLGLNRLLGERLSPDGYLGPHTAGVLGAYRGRSGSTRSGELDYADLSSLQSDLSDQTPVVILLGPRAMDVAWRYERHGFEAFALEDPSPHRLAASARALVDQGKVPSIVHLSGGLRQSSGGVSFTFVGGAWMPDAYGGARSGDEVTATALDRMLAAFPRDRTRPVVVLELDYNPPGRLEGLLNILLRNVFAHDVFALGGCAAVLGTGLPGRGERMPSEHMFEMFGAGKSLSDISARLRENTPEGTVLFTHLPWLRVTAERNPHGDR
ncbi:exonuclease SbcC [Alloactinosynnema sp. L-07]|uniref:hypothetical protein n=1 Tax=Alloactinosynnema sp. L-07 TaxID=1653480 RepID=UPI00065EFDD7|nr:hypothetical protein [Alloactinosynnema sp. L-07]CRK57704.1 exonuclease SbcC [Alloactinosynnema sp. L-07]